MADITEERLREIVGTPLSLAPAVCNYVDAWYFAAELLAAREKIRADEEHLPTIESLTRDLYETEQELRAARAQLHADDQRAWETLGKPEGTYSTTNVQRLCAEVERLRADMREAVELLNDVTDKEPTTAAQRWLLDRVNALLAKHKETP